VTRKLTKDFHENEQRGKSHRKEKEGGGKYWIRERRGKKGPYSISRICPLGCGFVGSSGGRKQNQNKMSIKKTRQLRGIKKANFISWMAKKHKRGTENEWVKDGKRGGDQTFNSYTKRGFLSGRCKFARGEDAASTSSGGGGTVKTLKGKIPEVRGVRGIDTGSRHNIKTDDELSKKQISRHLKREDIGARAERSGREASYL